MIEKANVVSKTTTVATKTPVATAVPEKRLKDTDNPVLWTVIGLKDCPWTDKTINLLKEHNEEVKHILLNAEWQRRLIVEYGTRKSPAIFKGGQYVGSYSTIEDYYKCWFFKDSEVL